jgi:hypothetical protein
VEAQAIEIDEARELVVEHVSPLGSENVELHAALGRVLAEAVESAGDVPPFDGYDVVLASPPNRGGRQMAIDSMCHQLPHQADRAPSHTPLLRNRVAHLTDFPNWCHTALRAYN